MTQINLPRTNQTGTNEWSDVETNDAAIAAVVNGQLQNDNIASNAQIAHSKLADATAGKLLIANASGVITATTASGDVTVAGSGAVTIANDAVNADKLKDSASTDADRAVTTNHIRDDAVTQPKIGDDAVGAAQLNLATATSGNSTTSNQSSSFGTNLRTISLDPGTYLVNGGLTAEYRLASAEITILPYVASGTATISPSVGAEATTNTYIAVPYTASFSAIVVVTATASIALRFIATDTWSHLASHITAFGVKD